MANATPRLAVFRILLARAGDSQEFCRFAAITESRATCSDDDVDEVLYGTFEQPAVIPGGYSMLTIKISNGRA